jgi:Flp pilus assembly pilin Flp
MDAQPGHLRRLWGDEEGQDLVEYGLLVVFIVLASFAVWNLIVAAMTGAYTGYDNSLWTLFWKAPGA